MHSALKGMDTLQPSNKKPEPDRVYETKTRLCLKCRKSFESGWEGERICSRCKSKLSWREGARTARWGISG